MYVSKFQFNILCISDNLGYIGCNEDVINIVDGACSGKQHCEFPVWTNLDEREDFTPCLQGLKMYLDVAYACVSGMS